MTKNVSREEMSMFAGFSQCTYNDEICFVGIEPKFIVCHLARDSSSGRRTEPCGTRQNKGTAFEKTFSYLY